ncbi:MAG TPA: Wzy polymerase domain-containing protein [Rhodoferax sp.]|nr:Wzy polymerase domain-containing protein [Rhodoferax sp.]
MPILAVFIGVTLPWLNPFSPGPTSAAGPFMFAWLCAAGVLLALAFDRQQGQHECMVRAIAMAWLSAAALSALIGLLQYFGATASFGVWLNHTGIGEAYGNLRQRNQFATLLNIGQMALLGLVANAGRSPADWRTRPGQHWKFALGLTLATLLGIGNAASSSRTGLLQLLLLAALVLWWQRGAVRASTRAQLVMLAMLLAYAAASLALPLLAGLDPLNSGAWARLRAGDAACTSRLTLWRNVLHLIELKPWLGWGWGELDYAHFITLYPGERFCDILDNAHNLPLHLAIELGIPFAVLACGLALLLVWLGRPWREAEPSRQMAWGILAVIGLHSLLEYPLWYGPFQIAALLCIWLLWWLPKSGAPIQIHKSFRPPAQYSKALAAIIITAFVGFATWNYHLASQIYLAPEARDSAYQSDTLAKIRHIWLFQDQVRFADLTTSELTASNATALHALALEMLHFSPEARVVEWVLDSALLLGHADEVAFFAERMRAAFPKDYAAWAKANPAAALPK